MIRLDKDNKWIDMVVSDSGHVMTRTTYEYDRSGRVRRKIDLWPTMRALHPRLYRTTIVYEYDVKGNVVRQTNYDAGGKLWLDTGILLSRYKYERVGNWIESRTTAFSPATHKWTLRSIATRTITYRK